MDNILIIFYSIKTIYLGKIPTLRFSSFPNFSMYHLEFTFRALEKDVRSKVGNILSKISFMYELGNLKYYKNKNHEIE